MQISKTFTMPSASSLQKRTLTQRGFTLIEIMIVIVIMGILAALIVPKIMDKPDEARIAAARQDIATIMTALRLYKLDNRGYPTSDQGLDALINPPSVAPLPPNWKKGGYLERLPKDPWGHDYQYLQPGVHGDVDVWSLGADNEPGGEDGNADVGNWS
jgi:general secretion pathway protein G